MRINLTLLRMSYIEKIVNKIFWQGNGENEALYTTDRFGKQYESIKNNKTEIPENQFNFRHLSRGYFCRMFTVTYSHNHKWN